MPHYRRHEVRLPAGQSLALPLALILDLVESEVHVRFFFEDAPGRPSACEDILTRFPQCVPFAGRSTLTNFDTRWDVAAPPATGGSLSRQTLLEIAGGIPDEFPVGGATLVIGPFAWIKGESVGEASVLPPALRAPPFSVRTPALTYLASGVILQRLSTGTITVVVTQQLDVPSLESTLPAKMENILQALGASLTGHLISVPDHQRLLGPPPPPPPDPAAVHARFRGGLPSLLETLELPHLLPGPEAFAAMSKEPLGEIRSVIVRYFGQDGWRRSSRRLGAGTHELCKSTASGLQLVLYFDTGSWLRFVTCIMKIVSERGAVNLPVPADRTQRFQHLTPNREVFHHTLENLRVVVRYLERTWVREMEQALIPRS